MFNRGTRKEIEKRTVFQMIEIYCHAHHRTKDALCESCQEVYNYAAMKYERCPFGEKKPVCSKCKVHCYNKEKREKVREIMRYSGPRMIFKHPLNTIFYFYHKYTVSAPEKIPAKAKVHK